MDKKTEEEDEIKGKDFRKKQASPKVTFFGSRKRATGMRKQIKAANLRTISQNKRKKIGMYLLAHRNHWKQIRKILDFGENYAAKEPAYQLKS